MPPAHLETAVRQRKSGNDELIYPYWAVEPLSKLRDGIRKSGGGYIPAVSG